MAGEAQEATEIVTVRVPVALVDRLRALAEREDRSLSAEIRRALRTYADADERAAA